VNLVFRKGLLQIHRWTGLTLGLVIVYLAVTGLAMVFRPQLQPILERDLREMVACGARLPLDEQVARAREIHPGAAVIRIEVFEGGNGATIVRFADKQGVHVNSCTGAVLGQQPQWGGFFGTVEQLHRFKFIENADVTELIGGSISLVLALVMVGGGLAMWWPPNLKALKSSATLRLHLSGRAFDLNLHRTIGLYACLVILMSAVTSLTFTFEWARRAVFAATRSPGPAAKPTLEAANAALLPAETFVRRALSIAPDAREIDLIYPRRPRDAVEIDIVERDAPHPGARGFLYVDPGTGDVLRYEPYAASSMGNKVYRWLGSLHTGNIGGLPVQLLLFAGILGIPILGYTGIRSYLRRKFPAPEDAAGPRVRVKRITIETPETRVFELEAAGGETLPEFTPGSHIDVRIDEGLVRQYSLCNGPEDKKRYVIAVKREPDSRGGSRAMHERVCEGDVLSVGAPRNHFPIDPSASHHLLLAGGIGITPLISMARHLQEIHGSFVLQYFTRSIGHTAFHAFLSRPEFRGKVTFHYAVEPGALHQYLHRLLWQRPNGAHLYVCGPRPFMDLVEKVASASWPPHALHAEYFSANPNAFAGPRTPFEVTLALTGGTYRIDADKTIVEALGECGIEIPTSCQQGVCGTCVTGLLDGEADHRDAFLTEAERRAGDKIMPCVSRARSKVLVLDL
jgi:ferredoxin-NADP reductase